MSWQQGRGDAPHYAGSYRHHKIVYPTPARPIDCTILSDTWEGFDSHWFWDEVLRRGRTILHAKEGSCWCAGDAKLLRWNGYLAIWDHGCRLYRVLSLTARATEAFKVLFAQLRTLRGLRCVVKRSTEHPSSEYSIVPSRDQPLTPLPPAFPLLPILGSVYGYVHVEGRQEAADNKGKASQGNAGGGAAAGGGSAGGAAGAGGPSPSSSAGEGASSSSSAGGAAAGDGSAAGDRRQELTAGEVWKEKRKRDQMQ